MKNVAVAATPPLEARAQLQAVVFDMDGVIVDSHPAHRFAWREFLRMVGKDVSDSELDFVMDGRKREDIFAHFLGPLTSDQLKEYGRLKNDLFWQAAAEVVAIPGATEFIDRIRQAGIVVAVATSASASRTQSILERMGLMPRIQAVVTGDEVSKGKPDPGIYQLACRRVNCLPDAAVAIEDAASGVRAAKMAGMRCVGIAGSVSANHLTAAGADCVLRDFVDLTIHGFHILLGMQPRSIFNNNVDADSRVQR